MNENKNLERGAQLFEMGRYNDGISYLKNALSEDVNNFEAKYLLAQSYFQTDDLKNARLLANELLSIEPNFSGTYLLLSQIHLHQDNVKEAINLIDEAIALDPYDTNLFGQKAYVLLQQKKFERALHFANEGLKLDAKSTFCLNARAIALTKLERKDDVKKTVENLLNDNPNDSYSHANVGWSELEHSNTEDALKHFKEALQLNPNLEYAREGMLTALKAKNKIYNLYLKYSFWISKKSEKNQWYFIIGLYLVYRFSFKILSASGLTILAIPLVIAYLLFALGSWIMDPLSNMILLFDSYGKYVLDKKERLSGILFFALLAGSLTSLGLFFILNSNYLILIGLTFLAAILPIARSPLMYKNTSKSISYTYGGAMLIIAIIGSIIQYNFGTLTTIIIIMFIGYTWLSNLFIK